MPAASRKRNEVLLIACVTILLCRSVEGPFDGTIRNHRFRGLDSPLSGYQVNVERLMRDLIMNTGRHSFSYYASYGEGNDRVYGHAGCMNRMLSIQECSDCVRVAHMHRVQLGPFVRGAQMTLRDCELRFEDYYFFDG
ncbi:hypothetical protein MLD38_017171 [Melastoma candidum]|uniref:Uncharacterized protein n=1 Tax=Melastoma candidum TaxID=119954 RepID=A0ACB9QRN1_9MYRT|nr:hypothetical protein MLD38_017171 [Melastoma candidum]